MGPRRRRRARGARCSDSAATHFPTKHCLFACRGNAPDPLGIVVGFGDDLLQLRLELELLLERCRSGAVEQPLRQPDRLGRPGRELRGELSDTRAEIVSADYLRDQPPVESFARREHAPGAHPLERAAVAKERMDEQRAARVWNQTGVDERRNELRALRRDADITGAGQR